jgi:5-(carboxyamino)imidazole ribonucleotide mutase
VLTELQKECFDFAEKAEKNGFGVIVAGAGGAAHLAGMVASLTTLPVLGVPMETKKLKGLIVYFQWLKCLKVFQ